MARRRKTKEVKPLIERQKAKLATLGIYTYEDLLAAIEELDNRHINIGVLVNPVPNRHYADDNKQTEEV